MYPGRPCPPRSGVGVGVGVGVGAAHVWSARLLSTMEARRGGRIAHEVSAKQCLVVRARLSRGEMGSGRWRDCHAREASGPLVPVQRQQHSGDEGGPTLPAMSTCCIAARGVAARPAGLSSTRSCRAGEGGGGITGARRGVFDDAQVPVKTGFLRSAFAWTPSAKSAEFMAH